MPTQKRKHDDFRRAANKPGQRKISFNTRSRHLRVLCSTIRAGEKLVGDTS